MYANPLLTQPPSEEEAIKKAREAIDAYSRCLDTVNSKESSCYCINTHFYAFTQASKTLLGVDRARARTAAEHQHLDGVEARIFNQERENLLKSCNQYKNT